MSSERGAPVRRLEEAEKERLAGIRQQAEGEWRKLVEAAPDDALGRLAWMVGATGSVHDAEKLRAPIDRARSESFTWRQIADALGEGDSPAAGRRVMDRRRSWG